MKKMIHCSIILLMLGSIQSISLASVPQTIHFVTQAAYPPFEFIDSKGQIAGFDIELAKALCQQIQVRCIFHDQSWGSLLPSLMSGKFDALISSINITDARRTQVDFTDPYYATTASFIGLKQSQTAIFSPADLKNKIIGIQSNTIFKKFLNDNYPDLTIKIYANSIQAALAGLATGQVDLVLADTPFLRDWLREGDNKQKYTLIGPPILDVHYFGPGYGIALKKEDQALKNAFNKALAEIKANGKYEVILSHYFEE